MFSLLHSELFHKPNAQCHIHFNNDHNNLGLCRGIIIYTRAVITKKKKQEK